AYYDKGNVLLEEDDLTSAVSAYSKAIELKPDFGEAYYNRGYAYMKLGNREAGVADLSKAGELGVLPAYNLLKRMTRCQQMNAKI
ncbi:MAG: tetratricopeptide repeat protein, partial [Muribaculaceae bacterium]|nr:tetratricopeptide repeat protein [Muribaculaceae bacterium]